jgi:hypothetical protein
VLAGDGEVPFEVGGAAGEVAGQAAGDDVALGTECVGARDFGRVGVFRGCAVLPGPDLGPAVAFFAFVDDDCVLGEEADDRFDVAIGIAFELAQDQVGEVGGHASSLLGESWRRGQRSAGSVLPGRSRGMAAQQ